MERRAASHTEEEEMNQRRRLLNLARKGDPKAIDRLFELYQVRVYSGEALKKKGRLPVWPSPHPKQESTTVLKRLARKRARTAARTARHTATTARSTRPTRRKAKRKAAHR